jgi:hypothetical protein
MASVYDTVIRLVGKDEGASDALRKVKGETEGLEQSTGLLDKAVQGLAAIGLTALAKQAAQVAYDLVIMGTEAARVGDAFARVTAGVEANGEAIADAMNAATQATVDDEDLMQIATNGMIMGLRLSTEEWGKLAEGARYHARLIGEDTTTVFAGMVEAITRGQPRMLAALKFPGARDAINELSEQMDGAAGSMTEAEKSAALLEVVMGTLGKEMAQFGELTPDMIDKVDALTIAWGNLKETIGQGLAAGIFKTLGVGELKTGGAVLEAMWKNQITPLQAVKILFQSTGERLKSLRDLFPEAADEGNRFARSLVNIADATVYMTEAQRVASLTPTVSLYQATPYERPYLGVTNIEWAKKGKDDAEAYADAWDTAWEDLRSTVEAALQATGVTAEDLAATASGSYVDKWDENIRRLNAIAANGFAELQTHPDWASVLNIPPEILAGTQDQLKDWAANTANAAPTAMFDIDKAVAIVEQYVAQQAAHDALIDEVARRYAEKHGMSVGAAKRAVGGVMGEEPADQGKGIAEKMLTGFDGAVKDNSPATQFALIFSADILAQAKMLKSKGMELWLAVQVGITQQMQDAKYAHMFAEFLAPLVVTEIINHNLWGGKGDSS